MRQLAAVLHGGRAGSLCAGARRRRDAGRRAGSARREAPSLPAHRRHREGGAARRRRRRRARRARRERGPGGGVEKRVHHIEEFTEKDGKVGGRHGTGKGGGHMQNCPVVTQRTKVHGEKIELGFRHRRALDRRGRRRRHARGDAKAPRRPDGPRARDALMPVAPPRIGLATIFVTFVRVGLPRWRRRKRSHRSRRRRASRMARRSTVRRSRDHHAHAARHERLESRSVHRRGAAWALRRGCGVGRCGASRGARGRRRGGRVRARRSAALGGRPGPPARSDRRRARGDGRARRAKRARRPGRRSGDDLRDRGVRGRRDPLREHGRRDRRAGSARRAGHQQEKKR